MKSIKLQEVKEAESRFAENINGLDLFWKIFNYNRFAIALSDEKGNLLLSNHLFAKTAVHVPSKINFFDLLSNHGREADDNIKEISVNTGLGHINLSFFKLPQKLGGASYLWLTVAEPEVSIQQKLITLKNLYRSFIDTSFELIFRTSLDGQFLFSNRLFLRSFGHKNYRSIKGSKVELIFEDPSVYKNIESRLLLKQQIHSEKVWFKKEDGSRLTGLVNCQLHHDESGTSVFNWTVLDVSRQVESENDLISKNEQLAKVNHQMEKFLYSTSHDLRSPITSILGLINLMRMESKEPTILDYILKIESSTLKLDKIIKDIMSFSRTTYQRVASERIDFELSVWRIINNYRNDPSSRKINFEVKVEGGFPFYTDSGRLDIIFENVIRNSIHFYDPNKSRSFIRVNVTISSTDAQMEIIDNGIGIGQQHLDYIFNMFYKASHVSKGAGLGLYIVKETVEKLEGSVKIESEIGFGTVVRITIPNDHKGKLISRKLRLQNNA